MLPAKEKNNCIRGWNIDSWINSSQLVFVFLRVIPWKRIQKKAMGETEKVRFESTVVYVGRQFHLLPNHQCRCFQNQAKLSSMSNRAGQICANSAGTTLLPWLLSTGTQQPWGLLPMPKVPRGIFPKRAEQNPLLLNYQQNTTTGMGTGMGTGTGTVFIMAIGFAATSSRQHRSFWQQKPADTLNYAKVVFREIVITNILSQSSRH